MTAPRASSRWLHGPVSDLLLGCGVWYVAAFVLLCFAGGPVRQRGGLALLPLLTLVFGTPHYGATLLRVYRNRDDRRAYTLFTVHVSLALFALFALGVHQALVGSLILTVYLTWSPWHYTGQNYGIAVMLLRRRGAAPSPGLKRLLYVSFLLSFLLTFTAQHSGGSGDAYAPVSWQGAGYRFLPIGFPDPFASLAITGPAAAYATSFLAATIGLVRAGGLATVAPALVLMFSQSLWFSIPLAARHWSFGQQLEPLSRSFSEYYFLWIAIAHSIQYLWVTSYYARSQGDRSGLASYSLQALVAGALVWTGPALLFAPGVLGRLPFDAGLGILVAATVNLHHFILDGAIWKLRDGRVARILLRPRPDVAAAPIEPRGPRWPGRLVWAAAGACAVILFYGQLETRVAERALNAGDAARADAALGRLDRIGLATARGREALGDLLLRGGDAIHAEAQYRRAIALHPQAGSFQSLGALLARRGDTEGALEAYRQAIALAPDEDVLHYEMGVVLLDAGRPAEARDAFARAVALNPGRGINRKLLERAERELARRGS